MTIEQTIYNTLKKRYPNHRVYVDKSFGEKIKWEILISGSSDDFSEWEMFDNLDDMVSWVGKLTGIRNILIVGGE